MSDNSLPAGVIQLPPGVTIAARRETTQQGVNGSVQQGMVYTLQLGTGATTSVFIPYALLGNTAAVSQYFAQRIAQLNAVETLQG